MKLNILPVVAMCILLMLNACNSSTTENADVTNKDAATPDKEMLTSEEAAKNKTLAEDTNIALVDTTQLDTLTSAVSSMNVKDTLVAEKKPISKKEDKKIVTAPTPIVNKDKKKPKASVTANTKPATPMPPKPKASNAIMYVEDNEYNFGTIAMGEKVERTFLFKNTGTEPLIIENAFSTCGCTIPEYPKTPIAPGSYDNVKITFDSAGKIGVQNKAITFKTNGSPNKSFIYLKGVVITENMMNEGGAAIKQN